MNTKYNPMRIIAQINETRVAPRFRYVVYDPVKQRRYPGKWSDDKELLLEVVRTTKEVNPQYFYTIEEEAPNA